MSAINKADLSHFFRTLYRYHRAGIATISFLEMYYKSCEKKEMKAIVNAIYKDMQLGTSLADAMRKHSVFPRYVIEMVAVGDTSSTLVRILEKIVFFLIQENDIAKKVNASVRQGIIMMVLLTIGTAIVLLFAIPKIGEILNSVHAQLPFITTLVLGISNTLKANGLLLGILFLFFIGTLFYLKKAMPERLDLIRLKIPIFGPILKTQIHSYFFSIIGICTMVDNITIPQAINYAARTITHIPTQKALFLAEKLIRNEGMSAAEAIRKADVHKVFDDEVYVMFEAGERTGYLQEIFEEEAKEYQKTLVRQSEEISEKLSATVIIPSMIVLICLLLSVYYPIFELVGAGQNGGLGR